MRPLGLSLLLIGFLWITWDAAGGFVGYQYTRWMWHSQQLPAGDTIQRTDAVRAMRELSIALKDRHRVILLPAVLMLAGGLLAAFGRRRQNSTV